MPFENPRPAVADLRHVESKRIPERRHQSVGGGEGRDLLAVAVANAQYAAAQRDMPKRVTPLCDQIEHEARLGIRLQEAAPAAQRFFAGGLGVKVVAKLIIAGVFPELPVAVIE